MIQPREFLDLGSIYLVNVKNKFIAPDGREYRSFIGTFMKVTPDTDSSSFGTRTEWYLTFTICKDTDIVVSTSDLGLCINRSTSIVFGSEKTIYRGQHI